MVSHVRHIPLTDTAVNTSNTRLVQYAYRYNIGYLTLALYTVKLLQSLAGGVVQVVAEN